MFENVTLNIEVKTSQKTNKEYTCVTLTLSDGTKLQSFDLVAPVCQLIVGGMVGGQRKNS